ncbi:hypothetical protein BDZ45DRAFT_396572 [Acephala macrosclerotiorum]|nr:hypothetical protein BDZ45DRAFT_396572 [Acephala macrosclerotiorum]
MASHLPKIGCCSASFKSVSPISSSTLFESGMSCESEVAALNALIERDNLRHSTDTSPVFLLRLLFMTYAVLLIWLFIQMIKLISQSNCSLVALTVAEHNFFFPPPKVG